MKGKCYRTFILESIFSKNSSEVLFWKIVAKELKKNRTSWFEKQSKK